MYPCSPPLVALKLPTLSRRNPNDISDYITQDLVGYDYLFNVEHLERQLKTHCPQLVLHDPDYDDSRLRHLGALHPTMDLDIEGELIPSMVAHFRMPKNPEQWPPALDEWIGTNTEGQPPSIDSPVIFTLRETTFTWPVSVESRELAYRFGELIQVRDDIKLVAASALQSMRDNYGTYVQFRTRDEAAVHPNAFIGIHLRVEKDAKDNGWMPYEDQARYIANRLQEGRGNMTHPGDPDLPNLDETIVYVATGNIEGVQRLAADIAPATVVTKMDLLPEGTQFGDMLRNMTWDQQALVDMLVLQHSGYFFGSRDSSLGWYIALRRSAAVNGIFSEHPDYCWLGDVRQKRRSGCWSMLADNEDWRDNLSTLIARGHAQLSIHFARITWP